MLRLQFFASQGLQRTMRSQPPVAYAAVQWFINWGRGAAAVPGRRPPVSLRTPYSAQRLHGWSPGPPRSRPVLTAAWRTIFNTFRGVVNLLRARLLAAATIKCERALRWVCSLAMGTGGQAVCARSAGQLYEWQQCVSCGGIADAQHFGEASELISFEASLSSALAVPSAVVCCLLHC